MGNSLLETKVAGAAAFAKFMTVLQAVAAAAHRGGAGARLRLSQAHGLPDPGRAGRAGHADGKRRRLSPRAAPAQLASRSWSQFDLRAALAPELQALRDATGETVHLAVPAGAEMVYIDKLESPGPVRMVSRVGAGVALHSSAVGKAYLAALGEAERERLLDGLPLEARMPSTLASLPALRVALAETARGYAVDDENEPGIVCYGVALRDAGAGRCQRQHAAVPPPRRSAIRLYRSPAAAMRPPPNSPCCQWHPALLDRRARRNPYKGTP